MEQEEEGKEKEEEEEEEEGGRGEGERRRIEEEDEGKCLHTLKPPCHIYTPLILAKCIVLRWSQFMVVIFPLKNNGRNFYYKTTKINDAEVSAAKDFQPMGSRRGRGIGVRD